ncbi:MAG: nucleotidyltransferase [Gammaproteobacteria bacterium]|nr:MAG: nucleotidyltransferase [Gammaproteobacteria bacterium]
MQKNNQDIRFIQRFENWSKSFVLLKKSIEIKNPSIIEKAGILKFFETTFELSWKVLKDYLLYVGYDLKSPRAVIKQAYSSDLIDDGAIWLDILEDRNRSIHTYDEAMAEEVYQNIKNTYFNLFCRLNATIKDKICSV